MRLGIKIAATLFGIGLAGAAEAQSSLPDPRITPGSLNPAVTQENIDQTICVRGWTKTVRPPENYTYNLKRRQIRALHYANQSSHPYEEDHLIPLGLGGNPSDPSNLWPEPWDPADGWGAHKKDVLEGHLMDLVCAHRLALADAQRAIAANWEQAYRDYVGE